MPGMSRETANAILPSSITLTVVCVVATVVFALMLFTRLGDRFPRIKNMSMMGALVVCHRNFCGHVQPKSR